MKKTTIYRRLFPSAHSPALGLAGLVLGCLLSAQAQTTNLVWDPAGTGTDGAGTWNNSSLVWTNPVAGGADIAWRNSTNDIAIFGAGNGAAGVVTVSGTVTNGGITFNTPGSGNYILNSGTMFLGNTAPAISNNANATIGSVIAGTSGLTKAGNGTLTITNAANTYSGANTINQGMLTALLPSTANGTVNDTTLGKTTVAISSGGTLFVDDTGNGTSAGERDLTVTNLMTGTGTVQVRGANTHDWDTVVFSGDLSGFTGTMAVLTNANLRGKVKFAAPSQAAVLSPNATISISNGTTLYLNQALDFGSTIHLYGAANVEATGQIRMEGGARVTNSVVLHNNSFIGGNNGFITGVISETGGSFGFTKVAGGVLTNSGANTYSGKTIISAGTLSVSAINNTGNAGNLGENSTVDINNATLQYTGAGETCDRVINLAGTTGGATINNLGAGLLKFTSNLTATNGGNKTLTLGGATGTGELAGNITNGPTGSTALTKTGANTWTLSATTNTFNGQLQVNAGTLVWSTAGALAPTAAAFLPLNITAGGTLVVNGLLRYSGSAVGTSGYLSVGNNAAGGIGTITINSGGTLTFTNQAGNPNSVVGQQGTGGTSKLIVNGGTFNWDPTGGFIVGNGNGSGLLLITNGGTATFLKGTGNTEEGYIALGRNSLTSTGTVYLATGTLATDRVIARGVATPIGVGYVYFDGGTLKALGNQSDWLQAAVSGNMNPPNAVNINDGGAKIDANGFSVTINNNLLHGGVAATDGGVTKLGLGTLSLGGSGHTYTGPTIVSNGVLAVAGSLPAGSAVTVAGGTLTVSGSVGGAVTVQPGGAIGASSGTFSSLVTLNTGNSAVNLQDGAATTTTFANGLTLNNGNVLAFDLGSASDQISVPGTFTHNGTATINLAAISGITTTTYTLISDGASDIASTNGFVIGTIPGGYAATLGVSGGSLTVTLTQSAPSAAYWKGDVDNKWNTLTGGINSNWATDSTGATDTGAPPGTPTAVTFAAAGAANFNTVLGADFTISSLALSTANNVTIGGTTNALTIIGGLLNDTTALNNTLSVSNVVLGSPQTWQNNSANPLTVSSKISGASDLTFGGTGTIVLVNTNNNFASSTVSGGTLQLGDGAASNGAVMGGITNNSVVTFANPAAQSFSDVISGTGQLVKTGAGTLTFPADNSYANGTTVSNGTLVIMTANGASSGGIEVKSSASLVCQPTTTTTYANAVTGTGLVKILFGNEGLGYNNTGDWFTHLDNLSGFNGTIQLSATTVTNVNKWSVEAASVSGTSSLIIDSGAQMYLNGGNSLTFSAIQINGSGNYQNRGAIRAGSGTLTGAMSLLGNTTFGTEGGTIAGSIASGASGTQVLTLGGASDLNGNITVSANIGGGTGTMALNKINSGTTTLSGNNTFTGPTTNSAGTLTLANGSALQNSMLNLTAGTLVFDSSVSSNAFVFGGLTGTANITLANNGGGAITLNVGNNNSSSTYSGGLSDSGLAGSLTKIGNGTLTLSGANSYSGTTTVSGGKLVLSTVQTNATAGIVVNDGATLTLNVSGTNQLAPAAYALGSSLGATNEFVGLGSTTIAPVNAGTLTVNGAITVNIGGGGFAMGNAYPLIAFTSISGSGGFVVGSLPRGMTSATIVTNGSTIALNVTGYSKTVDLWTGNVNTNWDVGTTTNWLVGGNPNIYLDNENARFDDTTTQTNVYVTTIVQPFSTVVSNATKTYTFTGSSIGGAGSLNKQGAGTLVLAQANTYTGNTVISNGTLQVGAGGSTGSLGAGDVTDNAALYFDLNANVAVSNNISGSGTVTVGGGNRLHFAGTHTESGATTINSGSVLENNAVAAYSSNSDYTVNGILEAYANTYLPSATIGALNGSGTVYNTASTAGTTVFTVGANGDTGTFFGVIANGAWGANVTALTKSGAGAQTLGGANTYSGATTISGGTLLVNGSTAAGAVAVNSGALGGTGTVGGAVTVNSGGTLAPGSGGIGALTISGNITLNAGSTNIFEVNGSTPANDTVVAGGAVTYGGDLNIVPSGSFTAGQHFTLFSGAGATNVSNFASIAGSPGSGLAFSFTNGVLSVVTTGPSGPAAITNSFSGGALSLSWPAGQGWRLQMQTNNLTTGLGTNWTYVTDGSMNTTNITVDPSKPTVFYRLTYP